MSDDDKRGNRFGELHLSDGRFIWFEAEFDDDVPDGTSVRLSLEGPSTTLIFDLDAVEIRRVLAWANGPLAWSVMGRKRLTVDPAIESLLALRSVAGDGPMGALADEPLYGLGLLRRAERKDTQFERAAIDARELGAIPVQVSPADYPSSPEGIGAWFDEWKTKILAFVADMGLPPTTYAFLAPTNKGALEQGLIMDSHLPAWNRDELAVQMRTLLRSWNAVALFQVHKAWSLELDEHELPEGTTIRDHPEAQAELLMLCATPFVATFTSYPILGEHEDGRVDLGNPEEHGAGGVYASWLTPHVVSDPDDDQEDQEDQEDQNEADEPLPHDWAWVDSPAPAEVVLGTHSDAMQPIHAQIGVVTSGPAKGEAFLHAHRHPDPFPTSIPLSVIKAMIAKYEHADE